MPELIYIPFHLNAIEGYIRLFGIAIITIIIFVITGVKIVYDDWQRMSHVSYTLNIVNDSNSPIPQAKIWINNKYLGQTDSSGIITSSASDGDSLKILIERKPYNSVYADAFVRNTTSTLTIKMKRPYTKLKIIARDNKEQTIEGVSVSIENAAVGITNNQGSLVVENKFRIFDEISIFLKKRKYQETSVNISLRDTSQTEIITMTYIGHQQKDVKTSTSQQSKITIFNERFDKAGTYLNQAIAGEKRYFNRALNEISSALEFYPHNISAKRLKGKIHYHFAKTFMQSNVISAAEFQCLEGLKMYNEISEDQVSENLWELLEKIRKSKE